MGIKATLRQIFSDRCTQIYLEERKDSRETNDIFMHVRLKGAARIE